MLATIWAVGALLSAAVVIARNHSRLSLCVSNLRQVNGATIQFAGEHDTRLPAPDASGDVWWWYKEQVKGYIGLKGPSTPQDKLFACPEDRGYSDPKPFHQTPRVDYSSYVFNGVIAPGIPNIAGWSVSSVREPRRTLLTMEWCAHGPLSWHRSRTGKANAPFYRDAESVVGFVDGHAGLTRIYHDGYSAAYTRDPISGYDYKYSGR